MFETLKQVNNESSELKQNKLQKETQPDDLENAKESDDIRRRRLQHFQSAQQ